MENAASALKMSAAILIFIIAIGASFSLFGTAKQTADSIITMRDKQKYLEAAELDNGILYTSSEAIKGDGTATDITTEYISGVTIKGDRVVEIDDVISTIYRYAKEKYGVTIIKSDGTVIARFDSNTESIIRQYNEIKDKLELYQNKLKEHISTTYVNSDSIKFPEDKLEELYTIKVEVPDPTDPTSFNIIEKYGAPWYGNQNEIEKRVNADISGDAYKYNGQEYQGKELHSKLKDDGTKIVEVTNEIDQSTYLKDGDNITDLLQQYQMPTVEIIYIVYN